jgi:hypothetical protein
MNLESKLSPILVLNSNKGMSRNRQADHLENVMQTRAQPPPAALFLMGKLSLSKALPFSVQIFTKVTIAFFK